MSVLRNLMFATTCVALTAGHSACAEAVTTKPAGGKPVVVPANAAATAVPIAVATPPKQQAVPRRHRYRYRYRYRSAKSWVTYQVGIANRAAIQEPRLESYINANQVYAFVDGAIYRLFTASSQVSDVALAPGEQLVAISAGDTARWVIGDTSSGAGPSKRVHVLVKPMSNGLHTNLVITTNVRTYHLILESTSGTAMVAVSWTYPQDALIALTAQEVAAEPPIPVATSLSLEHLNFAYALSGDKPAWRPVRVFDDAAKVYIQFPEGIAQGDLPPLFIIGEGGKAELVNYRVQRNYLIVDRLFEIAELRLGATRQAVVRLTKTKSPISPASAAIGGGHD